MMECSCESDSARFMNIRKKTFNGVVALAVVQQQQLAVARGAIAAGEHKSGNMRNIACGGRVSYALMLVSLNLSITC
jgi:hypothetical protein